MTEQGKMRRLRGDWMNDGYLDDLAPRELQVVVFDGRAYDAETCGMPGGAGRLSLDADGSIRGWGQGRSFSPDAGEIDRIGGADLFTDARGADLSRLAVAGRALYGPQWQTPLAKALGVSDRTMRRWAADERAVPDTVWRDLPAVCEARIAEIVALKSQMAADRP